jgi:very-short-patch-repair endonuclease
VGKNHFCPYCANQTLCDSKCKTCVEKSFASHYRSKFWSSENEKLASQVFRSSNIKYKFDCFDCGQIYVTSPSQIHRGSWCSCTKNKTETKLFNFLKSKLSVDVEKQAKFDWCKNKNYLPFDFLIDEFQLLLELDGRQHFSQVGKWDSPEETQKNDIYKMKQANWNDYSVIRIVQEDVWNDKNNWQINLMNCIKEYDIPVNIYIGDKYDYPYRKIGSTYEVPNRINIDPMSYVLKYINTVVEYEYYNTIFFNHQIDCQDTKKLKKILLANPYFHSSLISFIRYKNNKKKQMLKQT